MNRSFRNWVYILFNVLIFIFLCKKLSKTDSFTIDSVIIVICLGCYIIFQTISFILLNRLVFSDSDKIPFYIKTVIISIVSIVYCFGLFNNIKYLGSFIGVSLIIDILVQVVKIFIFSRKRIELSKLKSHGIDLNFDRAKKIIEEFHPDYNYFYVGRKKDERIAIDSDTFKHLKDICILKEEFYEYKRSQKLKTCKMENEIIKITKLITKNNRTNTSLINRKRK